MPGTGSEQPKGTPSTVPGHATVMIPGELQQRIGVRLGRVEKGPLKMSVRAVGIVQPDETRIARVNIKTEGWVSTSQKIRFQALVLDLTGKPAAGVPLEVKAVARIVTTSRKRMVGGFYTSAIGFGWNTELLRKKKLPEPKCWSDMIRPEYKGDIEISHPASSGTAYTILAGLVQLMGEEPAFDYMKKLHRNISNYTRSGQAQAPNVAKGEVAIGISFIFGFDGWRHNKYPVKTVAPCEGTSYEVGGIAMVKGQRNKDAARRYYDWLMSPQGQAIGAQVNSLQVPANKTFKPDPKIPQLDAVRLIKYDFEKYGKAAERRRLLARWTKEVDSLPR